MHDFAPVGDMDTPMPDMFAIEQLDADDGALALTKHLNTIPLSKAEDALLQKQLLQDLDHRIGAAITAGCFERATLLKRFIDENDPRYTLKVVNEAIDRVMNAFRRGIANFDPAMLSASYLWQLENNLAILNRYLEQGLDPSEVASLVRTANSTAKDRLEFLKVMGLVVDSREARAAAREKGRTQQADVLLAEAKKLEDNDSED